MILGAVMAMVVVSSNVAQADDAAGLTWKWSKVDVGLEMTFAALMLVDYTQTRAIMANGHESNYFLARDVMTPEVYFLSATVIHAAVAVALPQEFRKYWQGVAIGVQVGTVASNWQAGYTIEF